MGNLYQEVATIVAIAIIIISFFGTCVAMSVLTYKKGSEKWWHKK